MEKWRCGDAFSRPGSWSSATRQSSVMVVLPGSMVSKAVARLGVTPLGSTNMSAPSRSTLDSKLPWITWRKTSEQNTAAPPTDIAKASSKIRPGRCAKSWMPRRKKAHGDPGRGLPDFGLSPVVQPGPPQTVQLRLNLSWSTVEGTITQSWWPPKLGKYPTCSKVS